MTKKINYETYRKYLCALQDSYKKRKDLSGIGKLSKRYRVTHLTKEQFFEFNVAEGEITMERAIEIRNKVSIQNRERQKERDAAKALAKEKEQQLPEDVKFSIESLRLPYPLFSKIIALNPSEKNPYRYALQTPPCDNLSAHIRPVESPVVEKLLEKGLSSGNGDYITFFGEFNLPTMCDANDSMLHDIRIGVVKFSINGATYWLCKSDIVLKLLAWISSYFTKELL